MNVNERCQLCGFTHHGFNQAGACAAFGQRTFAEKKIEELESKAMSAWVSIGFAPKDGTVVDLWVVGPHGKKGRRIADCYWTFATNDKGEREPDGPFDGWCCDVGKPGPNSWNPYPNLIEGTPTHYSLPLPGPNT